MLERNRKKIGVLLLYICFCVLLILALSKKETYNQDEVSSYGLANHQGTLFLSAEIGKIYKNAEEPFLNYMTVKENERWDYYNVWIRQGEDVHPPLYYAVLHTISSFFPEKLSKWFAGSINIVFSLLSLFVLRKIACYFTQNDEVCFLISVGYVLSSGIIASAMLFRMYNMAMFWVLLISYLFLKMLEEGVNNRLLVMLFITTVLAALTHYYCIIYIVLISCVWGSYLMIKKQFKTLCIWGVMMLGAGGSAILVFPKMLSHIFSGYRGVEAFNNFQNNSDYWGRLKSFFSFISVQVFGGWLGYLLLILVVGGLYVWYSKKGKAFKGEKLIPYLLVFLPIIFYFLLVSKTAAFQIDRYIFPIYGIAFVTLTCFFNILASHCFSYRQQVLAVCILIAFMTNGSWKGVTWAYLDRGSKPVIELAQSRSEVDCICISDVISRVHPRYREISSYASVTFVPLDNLSYLPQFEKECEKLVVIIMGTDSHEEYLSAVMDKYPKLTQYEKTLNWGEGTTYYLSVENNEVGVQVE